VDFAYSPEDDRFREEVRAWFAQHKVGPFAALDHNTNYTQEAWPTLVAWEQELGRDAWVGMSWPKAFGGREASVLEELIFAQEYFAAGGSVRAGFFGENLLGPTLAQFGTPEQKERFLPNILQGTEYWCQGFSEPNAGSDLAGVQTRAALDGDQWVVNGQKVWTSQAQFADWIFVLARTDADVPKHKGLSYLLVPLDQPGVEVRPLVDMVGHDHFCEIFFDDAVTDADLIVGGPGDGWKVAMGTLGFERGTAFLAQQQRFALEFRRVLAVADRVGAAEDPTLRQRLADSFIGLEILRYSGYRTLTNILLTGQPGPEASVGKLQWSRWHQRLGELEMDVLGASAMVRTPGDVAELQDTFLFSRAHTIYAGASEIQRNIVGERVLGLPKEPG
jgi:alkylation response protein AidB-like acyl-CoA dehydrogenase